MNIRIITLEPFPTGLAASNRIMAYAKGFLINNCNVSIICMKPTENPCNPFNLSASGRIGDIYYSYSCGKTIKSQHFLTRRIDNFKGIFRICLDILKEKKADKTDVIIYYSTSTTRAILLYLVTRIKRILFIKEESELPVVYSSKMGFIQRRGFEEIHYLLFDGLLLMTKRLVKYFQEENKINKPFIHVPMTVDPERFVNLRKSNSGNKYIAYCGTLNSNKDGVDFLIDAFVLIAKDFPEVNLYLIGECATEREYKSYIEKIKSRQLDKRVIFTGRVSGDAMPEFLSNALILVSPRPLSVQAEGGFPTKLGEYLATGNPVITTSVGEIPDYLTDGQNVFMAEPGNVESLAGKIREVFYKYEKAKKIGYEGQKIALQYFNPIIQTKSIIDFIKSFR
jgi:glycosyltransferase involved in cell wall biosynthesis